MKKILIPMNLEQIKKTLDLIDGYIIGIRNMSVNTFYNIDINELDQLFKKVKGKEVFISVNKNIENKDLDLLKEILTKLKDYPISGVLYSDVCFVNLKDQLELNYPLVWNQEHLVTNYETINYWDSFGINCIYLSSDISYKDMVEISKKTKTKLMVNILGYLPMFISKRHIVKNYLNKFKINDSSNVYYMEKENKCYPIIDNNIGTQVLSSNILNGIREYNNFKKMGFNYVVISGFSLENQSLVKILKIIRDINEDNVLESETKINNILPNVNTGFMYQETLSRVKKNEK